MFVLSSVDAVVDDPKTFSSVARAAAAAALLGSDTWTVIMVLEPVSTNERVTDVMDLSRACPVHFWRPNY